MQKISKEQDSFDFLKYLGYKLCGKGLRQRDVTCFQKNLSNGTIEVLEEDNCTQEKPEIEEECEAENPCGSVDWLVTDWSGCPETCGKF